VRKSYIASQERPVRADFRPVRANRVCPRYALQAFNVRAADYLLKLFDRKRLHHALVSVRTLAGGDAEAAAARLLNLVAAVRASRYLERIVIKSTNCVYFVRAADVDRIEAAGRYLSLHVGHEEHGRKWGAGWAEEPVKKPRGEAGLERPALHPDLPAIVEPNQASARNERSLFRNHFSLDSDRC
jgi:hypothetical protein